MQPRRVLDVPGVGILEPCRQRRVRHLVLCTLLGELISGHLRNREGVAKVSHFIRRAVHCSRQLCRPLCVEHAARAAPRARLRQFRLSFQPCQVRVPHSCGALDLVLEVAQLLLEGNDGHNSFLHLAAQLCLGDGRL